MKIEIIKEERLEVNGIETTYSINVDGRYVPGTSTYHLDQVNEFYKTIKSLKRKPILKEVIKSEKV